MPLDPVRSERTSPLPGNPSPPSQLGFATVVVALLPLVDLILVSCSDVVHDLSTDPLVGPVPAYLQLLLSWAAVLLLIYAIVCFTEQDIRPVRWLAGAVAFSLTTLVLLQCLLSWVSLVMTGYPPSPDLLSFLVLNATRIPAHLLQSSPLGAVLVVAALAGGGGLILYSLRRLASRFAGSLPALRATCLFGLSVGALALLSPYVPVSISSIGILSTGVSIVLQEHALDATLEETFAPLTEPSSAVSAVRPDTPVIIVLAESLRRDLIELEPTPIRFLKSLVTSREAFYFDKAYATASHSNYADVAFWYSRYPLRSLNLMTYDPDDPARGESLFAVLKKHGYKTGYVSSQNEYWGGMIHWLNFPSEVDYFFHSEDFDGETWEDKQDQRGLAKLREAGVATAGKIEDSQTLKIAAKWIQERSSPEPFFLGMNLQNTHFSYVFPDDDAPYQPDDLQVQDIYYSWPEEHKDAIRNRYLNAVHHLDTLLEGFVGILRERGVWDECLFVLVGDSGESFYEHGYGNHSGPMYDETIRTFALMKFPKGDALPNEIHERPISHLDFPATVLDYLGVERPAGFQGESFLAGPRSAPIYMHSNAVVKQHGLVDWPWKLLETHLPYRRTELYNLEEDPFEKRNFVHQKPEVVKELTVNLDRWVGRQLLYYSAPKYFLGFQPPR